MSKMKITLIHYKFVIVLCFFSVFLFINAVAQSNGENYSSLGFSKLNDDVVPAPFIFIDKKENSNILLVEKREQRLTILKNDNGQLSIEKIFLCSTGKAVGNKEKSGDLKTPEGVYFFRSRKDSTELPPLYGAGAMVLDYPNRHDDLNGKNGNGIWLHGTNEPERIKNSNDTRGCVVLVNEDFLEVVNYIQLNKTPIIIVNELDYRKKDYVDSDRKDILEFVSYWRNNWVGKNLKEFISCYSSSFRQKNMNINAFRNYKRRLFNRYKNENIDVKIDNIQILKGGNCILVSFLQEYMAESFSDFGMKQLYLIKRESSYKIIGEHWTERKIKILN